MSGFGLHQDLSLVDETQYRSAEIWVALDDTDQTNGTATIAGTPTATAGGRYVLTIRATNRAGSATQTLTITVNQASNGTATLDWTAVTQNMDGTTLTNLAGYNIHYGTSASNMSTTIQVSNASLTAYVVTNLSSGAWYFAVAAYTSGGTEASVY